MNFLKLPQQNATGLMPFLPLKLQLIGTIYINHYKYIYIFLHLHLSIAICGCLVILTNTVNYTYWKRIDYHIFGVDHNQQIFPKMCWIFPPCSFISSLKIFYFKLIFNILSIMFKTDLCMGKNYSTGPRLFTYLPGPAWPI